MTVDLLSETTVLYHELSFQPGHLFVVIIERIDTVFKTNLLHFNIPLYRHDIDDEHVSASTSAGEC